MDQGDETAAPERIDPPVPHEPALRAPWPVLGLPLLLIGIYALQSAAGDPQAVIERFGFSPASLAQGQWMELVTALFVHGSWTHVLMNAGWALAFAAPVARLFGKGPVAGAAFLTFFLVCGVAGSVAFALVHPGDAMMLIGASGGVSGLMGAGSRLIDRRNQLAPFASRTVIVMAAFFLIVNLMIGMVGLEVLSGDAPVAWEAHLAGYAAGLLLIGPAARLVRGALTKL